MPVRIVDGVPPGQYIAQVVIARLAGVFEEVQADLPIVFPIHPRTRKCIANAGLEGRFAEGDTVRTDAGRVELAFPDGTQVYLDRFAELEIVEPFLVRLARGRMFVEDPSRRSSRFTFPFWDSVYMMFGSVGSTWL